MPELPEVEIIRAGLQKFLPGLKITKETHDWPRGFPNSKADVKNFLIGAKILDVRRRGKALIIDLSNKYSLVVHLKMTGQLVFKSHKARFGAGHPNNDLVGELPSKATRVTLTFTDESQLFFNDQRKFGWMRLLPTHEINQLEFFKKLGPEPLEDDFTAEEFAARLNRRKNSPIKPVIMDQSVIAGVGNIYADEGLWAAKIHPQTLVKNVSPQKIKDLYKGIREVMRLSIKKGGSTDRNYVNAKGEKGSYLQFAHVFRREGKPCSRCGTTVIKIRVSGRGTHLCPFCQKVEK